MAVNNPREDDYVLLNRMLFYSAFIARNVYVLVWCVTLFSK